MKRYFAKKIFMKFYPVLICMILALAPMSALAEDMTSTLPKQANDSAFLTDAEEEDGFDADIFQDNPEEPPETYAMVADPLEGFNRAVFVFNDKLYIYGLKPLATGYGKVVPTPARKGVKNFFNNLMFPIRFVNNVLQGKGEAAGMEFSAFVINTTLGFGGLNDFAQKHVNITLGDEDLGQTLGSYGIGNGFFLTIPVLGPCTLRDAVGRAGDWFINPVNYIESTELSWGVWGLEKVNWTSFHIGEYEDFKKASLDPYTAMRNAYIQNRNALVNDLAGAQKLKNRED